MYGFNIYTRLDMLIEWCVHVKWSVEVDVQKCGVMHMRGKGAKRTEEKSYVGEEELAVVKDYKYLGCVVDERSHYSRMVEERGRRLEQEH